MILAPKGSQNPYLKIISEISKLIANYKIEELINVKTTKELYKKLTIKKLTIKKLQSK